MDQKIVAQLIEEQLHTILAWSLSKLYDKDDAEDLAGDIVCTVLQSAGNIRQPEAFYSFLWRTAENILRAKIRQKRRTALSFEESLENTYTGTYWETPEERYLQSEELMLLRRELTLLSHHYREATVQYYIHGRSCSEISQSLDISTEMVKYYLFKTRKILKEGIGMTREFGEKSYNPSTFCMDFWGGGDNSEYFKIFQRRLPGNILLAAYDKPTSISELCVELGVSAPYLEDEIKLLQKHDLIKEIGSKYQTNIVIFTDAYDKRIAQLLHPVYTKAAGAFTQELFSLLPQLKELDFHGKDYEDNRLKWTFANMAMQRALTRFDFQSQEKIGNYPPLSNGSFGFVYGYDNHYEHHHFNGIYGQCLNENQKAWISVINYRIIEKCQNWKPIPWTSSIAAMTDAVRFLPADENNEQIIQLLQDGIISCKDGQLSPEFPVIPGSMCDELEELLTPAIDIVCQCMEEICTIAAKTLADFVPASLCDKSKQLAYIRHQMDVMAYIIETMVSNNDLIIPNVPTALGIFGVDLTK